MGINEGYARYDVKRGSFSINQFLGFNAHTSRSDSEMPYMENLTSDEYPNLYQRAGRVPVLLPSGMKNIEKIFRAGGKLCAIADGKLWYGEKPVCDIFGGGERSVAICNGYICVMPDKVFYNYMDGEIYRAGDKITFANINAGAGDAYECFVCGNGEFYLKTRRSHDIYSVLHTGNTILFYGIDGELLDKGIISSVSSSGIEYSGMTNSESFSPAQAYVPERNERFILNMGCGIESSGREFFRIIAKETVDEMEKYSAYLDSIFLPMTKSIEFYSGNKTASYTGKFCDVYNIEDDYSGNPDPLYGRLSYSLNYTVADSVGSDEALQLISYSCKMPDIDFICEKDNRIFGVCSGDNTVVASKLGEPLEFNYFPGTSLDSYSVEVGSDGEFTGICAYAGDVILFKERYIHVLSGVKPSLFQLNGIEAFGVEKGSTESLSVLCGRLYYKSRRGVMVFDGSYPTCVSQRLGNGRYFDAAAGDDGRKYYISMRNESGAYELFVYDTDTGFWHREDDTKAVSMCELGGVLYIATAGEIFCTSGVSDEKVKWSAVFGPFDQYSENKKIVSSLSLRYKLSEGARLEIAVSFDGGEYEVLREIFYSSGIALECDVKLRRCNEFSIRLSGEGICRILGLSAYLREGTFSK